MRCQHSPRGSSSHTDTQKLACCSKKLASLSQGGGSFCGMARGSGRSPLPGAGSKSRLAAGQQRPRSDALGPVRDLSPQGVPDEQQLLCPLSYPVLSLCLLPSAICLRSWPACRGQSHLLCRFPMTQAMLVRAGQWQLHRPQLEE